MTFLLLFATPIRFRLHTRATDEAAAALNSCHSASTSTVHSGSSRNDDNTLSAVVFHTSLSTGASHFEDLPDLPVGWYFKT